jgi:hypothetical protein
MHICDLMVMNLGNFSSPTNSHGFLLQLPGESEIHSVRWLVAGRMAQNPPSSAIIVERTGAALNYEFSRATTTVKSIP